MLFMALELKKEIERKFIKLDKLPQITNQILYTRKKKKNSIILEKTLKLNPKNTWMFQTKT